MITSIPNILTIIRIICIPAIVYSFYIDTQCSRIIGFSCYTLACVTDFFDGYIAREFQITSKIGAVFDPVADKMLIITMLFLIVAFDYVNGLSVLPCLIIVLREVFVSGIREAFHVPVDSYGKAKTFTQMLGIGIILFAYILQDEIYGFIGISVLWISALLSVISAISYARFVCL